MDIWGTGCVLFEVLSLFPLFPGNDEADQIRKIHNILGTPPQEVLDSFQKHATHMKLNFTPKEGTGINKLITHVSPEAQDLISKMLVYTESERIATKQALNHPWFKELRNQEKNSKLGISGSLAFPEESAEGDLRKNKRNSKELIENQKSMRKIQQGSSKNLETNLGTEKYKPPMESDEPTVPLNVYYYLAYSFRQ